MDSRPTGPLPQGMLSLGGFSFWRETRVKYTKPPISSEQQADLLIARGMSGNRALIIERLNTVGYFRLSAYWYPFRSHNPADPDNPLDTFRPGTDFVRGLEPIVISTRRPFTLDFWGYA